MIIDHGKRKIMFKLVYFGPAMSGKTTSIKYLFKEYNGNNLQSIETEAGRTLFFDYGDLIISNKKDWEIIANVWTCTGQNFYAETRPTVLNGADGIIFVADAQKEFINDNIESWNELNNLLGDMIKTIPIIICLNKYDLIESKEVITIPELFKLLKPKKDVDIFKTIAIEGFNIKDSFITLINKITNLRSKIISY
ncbi:MAG: Rab family GTPase [Candidatus Helarchaeota archaeon]